MTPKTHLLLGQVERKWLGLFKRRYYLSLYGDEHVAGIARTGAGKTTALSVPLALTWPGSLLALDVKGEIYKATAGHRAHRLKQDVYCLNPTSPDGRSHCWNPLDVVDRTSIDRFDHIMRQSFLIIPDAQDTTPGGTNSKFWNDAARMALASIGWLIAETPGQPLTYENILSKFMRGDSTQWLTEQIVSARRSGRPYSQKVVDGISDYIGHAGQLHESIRKSGSTDLNDFQNPRICAVTARSDFDLRDLRRKPMSVYVTIAPGDIARTAGLLRQLFTNAITLNTDVTFDQDRTCRYPLLLLLDEFARLGVMPALTQAAQFARGYGIRLVYLIQDKEQLIDLYGVSGAADVVNNLGVEAVFGSGDTKLAGYVEERFGNWSQSYSTRNQRRFFPWLNYQSMTAAEHVHGRPLVMKQEVFTAPPERMFIIRPNTKPVIADKLFWPTDLNFAKLVCAPPPVPELKVSIAQDDGSIQLNGSKRPAVDERPPLWMLAKAAPKTRPPPEPVSDADPTQFHLGLPGGNRPPSGLLAPVPPANFPFDDEEC